MLMFREEKSPEDEIKAWQFWHGRQHSVKQRILDAGEKLIFEFKLVFFFYKNVYSLLTSFPLIRRLESVRVRFLVICNFIETEQFIDFKINIADTKNSVGLVGCIEEIAHNAIAVYWNPSESSAKVHLN